MAEDWVADFQKELDKTHLDLNKCKEILTGQVVPNNLRGKLWKKLLGITRKPDVLGNWKPVIGQLNNFALLQGECKRQADFIPENMDKKKFVSDSEIVLSFYCHAKSVNYRPGWAEILRPILTLELPLYESYNLFYTILEKYIQYAEANSKRLPYQLFRLLLQYHDPQLSHYLDSRRIDPHGYIYNWFRSVFANAVANEVIVSIWDWYFIEGDCFLVFFMALVLLVNAREDIMTTTDSNELLELMVDLPKPLSGNDAQDFLDCALHYSTETPQSLRRKDIKEALFSTKVNENDKIKNMNNNSNSNSNSSSNNNSRKNSPAMQKKKQALSKVSSDLCLSVSVLEVYRQLASNKNNEAHKQSQLFLIDCRKEDYYEAGHLLNSYHLDPDMMSVEPEQFQRSLESLQQLEMKHFCFYGTGDHDDDEMKMVISLFIQKGFSHVSYVTNGYKGFHSVLKDKLNELEDHNPKFCPECNINLLPKETSNTNDNNNNESISKRNSTSSSTSNRGSISTTGQSNIGILGSSLTSSLSQKLSGSLISSNENNQKNEKEAAMENEKEGPSLLSSFTTFWNKGVTEAKDAITKIQSPSPVQSPGEVRELKPISKSVFGIGDSDDEEESENDQKEEIVRNTLSENLDTMLKVNLDEWYKKINALQCYPCNEILIDGAMKQSHIVLTDYEFIVLRGVAHEFPFVYVHSRHQLKELIKITAKKKHVDLITYTFKLPTFDPELSPQALRHHVRRRRFLIPEGKRCSKVVGQLVMDCIGEQGQKSVE